MDAIRLPGHIDENGHIEVDQPELLPTGDVMITIEPISLADEAAETAFDELLASPKSLAFLETLASKALAEFDAGLTDETRSRYAVKSRRSANFRAAFAELPDDVKQLARVAYKRFKDDPYHPGLHFKKLHTSAPYWSVRISKQYRAVGIRRDDVIIWF